MAEHVELATFILWSTAKQTKAIIGHALDIATHAPVMVESLPRTSWAGNYREKISRLGGVIRTLQRLRQTAND